MRGSPPRGHTWGNSFIRDPKLTVEKGRWICVEQMIKMNDAGDFGARFAFDHELQHLTLAGAQTFERARAVVGESVIECDVLQGRTQISAARVRRMDRPDHFRSSRFLEHVAGSTSLESAEDVLRA